MSRASEEVLLDDHLHRLKLPAMLRQYRECGRAARESAQSYESYLLDLTTTEVEQRRARFTDCSSQGRGRECSL